MDNVMKNREVLKEKILERLNSEYVTSNEEEISFYDLEYLTKGKMNDYNFYFFKYVNNYLSSLDMDSITLIPFVIDNNCFINIIYNDTNIIINNYLSVVKKDNELSSEFMEFLKNNQEFLKSIFYKLHDYTTEFPNVDFRWDLKNKESLTIQVVSDDLFKLKIDLLNEKFNELTLKNIEDIHLSTIDVNDGELDDYIHFYNGELKAKSKVNINELNPLFKTIALNSMESIYKRNR